MSGHRESTGLFDLLIAHTFTVWRDWLDCSLMNRRVLVAVNGGCV